MKVRLDETLFKARAQENLAMTNEIDKLEQVDALVECLDHFVADRKWVDEITRDELLTMVTQSHGDKDALVESVLAKFNTPCIDAKKLKECRERRQNKGLKESMKNRKSLKESDNRDTFTLDTSNTPILDCGLYYTLLGELDPGRYDERFKEFEDCVKECAEPILDELVRKTPNFEVVSVGTYYHPRYYNYETDCLEFTVKYTGDELGTVIEEYSNNQDFIDFLQNYSSYDGFISFYADNKDEFVTQDYIKSVSQIIKYNVTQEDYERANEELYYDVSDCGFYPDDEYDEDETDESLKEKKYDIYVNGKYVASSDRHKRAKDIEDNIRKDGKIKYAGEKALKTAGVELDELNVDAKDKLKVKRARESKKLKENLKKKTLKEHKRLSEDIDRYDPDFDVCCSNIANALDDGWWHGITESEREWGLVVNGGDGEQFSPLFADVISYECSYPVRDGEFEFYGLDCWVNKSTFHYADWNDEDDVEQIRRDLLSVGCDNEEITKFINDEVEEIEFYIDFYIDIDDYEDDDAEESLKEGANTSDWDLMRKARDFTQEEVLKALKGVVSTKMYNDIKNDYKIAKLRHLTKSEQEKVANKLEKKNIKESLKEASKQDNKFAYRIYMRDKDKDFASGKDYKDAKSMLQDAKKDFELANNELRTNPKYLICMLFDLVDGEYYHYKDLYSAKEIEDEIKLEATPSKKESKKVKEDLDLTKFYLDVDGEKQKYYDWGVEFISNYKNNNIVKVEDEDKYTIWSKWNRPLSKITSPTNQYVPIYFDSEEEVKQYIDKKESCQTKKKGKQLKEGFYGQTLQDFLDDCMDYSIIDNIYIYGNNDVVYEGPIDDIPEDMLETEFLECDMYTNRKSIVTVNVDSSEEYGAGMYEFLNEFLDDCNCELVVIYDLAEGEEIFNGYKEDIPEEYLEYAFASYDAPEEMSVNLNDYEGEDDFDESLDRYSKETKDFANKLCRLAKKDNRQLKFEDACEVIDQSFNNNVDNIEDFYKTLNFDESLKEGNKALDKGKMITNSKGISYYQKGNKYYSNTGWSEKEITKDEFDKNVEQAFKEVDESLDDTQNLIDNAKKFAKENDKDVRVTGLANSNECAISTFPEDFNEMVKLFNTKFDVYDEDSDLERFKIKAKSTTGNLKEAKGTKDTLYLVRTKSGVFEVRAKNDAQALKQARLMQDEPVERVVNTTTNKVVFNLEDDSNENLKESLEDDMEKLSQVVSARKDGGKYILKLKWQPTRKKAHSDYVDLEQALKKKFGDVNIKLQTQEWRDNNKETRYILEVELKDKEIKEDISPLAKKMGAKFLPPKDYGVKKTKPRYVYEVYYYDTEDCTGDPIFRKFSSRKAQEEWYEKHKDDPDKFDMYAYPYGSIYENLKENKNYNELLKDAYKLLDDANLRFDVEGTTFEFNDDDDAENAWKVLAKKYGKNKVTKKGLFKVKVELDENLKESTIPVKDLLIKTDNKYGITLDHAIDDIKRERGYNDPLFGDNGVIDLLMKRYGLEKRDVIRVLNYKFDGKVLDEGCGRKKTSKRAK